MKHKTDPTEDTVFCWHWDNLDYDEYHEAEDGSGNDVFFPYIMGLDVAKVGVLGEETAIQNQHCCGSVAIMMHDDEHITTLYRLIVGQFGTNLVGANKYFDFGEDDDNENWWDGELLVSSFAAGYQYIDSSPYHQMLYLTSDRNPDLGNSNYEDDNIRIYEQE